jgi:hypothetical protein
LTSPPGRLVLLVVVIGRNTCLIPHNNHSPQIRVRVRVRVRVMATMKTKTSARFNVRASARIRTSVRNSSDGDIINF